MQIGEFRLWTNDFGSFLIDAGAMFGSVPKALWSKWIVTDQLNRATLATRSLLIGYGDRTFLVDLGCGANLPAKYVENFALTNIEPDQWTFKPEQITDIIITHLHFDHCGWLAAPRHDRSKALEPFFPRARVYLQRANYETALKPSLKERASYLREQVDLLSSYDLELVEGEKELLPGLTVCQSSGHTSGLQWVMVKAADQVVALPGDLIPSAHHLAVPYTTGYDIWVDRLLEEKELLLSRALAEKWIIVFQHDPETVAATVAKNERGHFTVGQVRDI